MIRISKSLIIFTSLIFVLGVFALVSLQKLSPLISHTAYYCQSLINSLSLPIPYYLGIIPFLLFFTFLLVAVVKLFIVYVKVQLTRKKLLKNCKFNTSFNTLLGKLKLEKKTYLIEDKKRFAFCLGVRSPKIYISTGLVDILTPGELEIVLRHEQYHLNNRDTLIMLIASAGESLLPFFPLISDFLRNYRIEREIKADAEAIQGFGDKKPLVSVLRKLLATPSMVTVTASAIADQDTLEPRIHALVKKEMHFRIFKAKHILISLFSVLTMSVITLAPVQAFEIHHEGEDAMMICTNSAECLNSCKQEYSTFRKNYNEVKMYTPIK